MGKVWSVSTIEENDARRQRIGLRLARQEGLTQGIEMGENQFAALAERLLAQGRLDDLQRATQDRGFRATLIKELVPPAQDKAPKQRASPRDNPPPKTPEERLLISRTAQARIPQSTLTLVQKSDHPHEVRLGKVCDDARL